MTSYLNNNANMPWVWSVAQRLEQQPRQLKMWGSIPCHAHNFLISFAIGVRTTIGNMITIVNLLKNYRGLFGLLCKMYGPCRYQGRRRRRLSDKTKQPLNWYINLRDRRQLFRVMTYHQKLVIIMAGCQFSLLGLMPIG